jgi:hypothetical protein
MFPQLNCVKSEEHCIGSYSERFLAFSRIKKVKVVGLILTSDVMVIIAGERHDDDDDKSAN